MRLIEDEVPVAYSMIKLARSSPKHDNKALQDYICYWAAFNNVYKTIAAREGQQTELKRNDDGTLKTRTIAGVKIPIVNRSSERYQIDIASGKLSDDIKDRLIKDENTRFFVYRTPVFDGERIEIDSIGQRLNGVINIGYTSDKNFPIWSPIDVQAFEQYIENQQNQNSEIRDELTKQIVNLLYTIRNNIVHAGKRANDASDCEVAEKAIPLLRIIISNFIHDI